MNASDPPCVLVVDDDPDIRTLYAHYLQGAYRVRSADSGEAALQTIDDAVDAVLLDRRMADLSGRATLERLRDADHRQPVAMVTAVEPDFDIIGMGFDDYVVKPVDRDGLVDLVETLLVRRTYDDVVREYFALASRVYSLKQQKTPGALAVNDAYADATDRLAELKVRSIATLEVAAEAGKFDELLQDAGFGRECITAPE